MSSAASFIRAASPAFAAISAISATGDTAKIRRHTILQGASTVDELIAMVPQDYRVVLRDPLIQVAAITTKLYAARATLAKWQAHKAQGTYPSHLVVKAPEVQVTKDFGATDVAQTNDQALKDAHKAYLDRLLDNAIKQKAADVSYLEHSIGAATLAKTLIPIVQAKGEELLQKHRMPVLESVEGGEIRLARFELSPAVLELRTHVAEDCLLYAYRVISIVEAREASAKTKVDQKKKLREQADVEMADATKPGPSIQSMIDKAVNARLKKTAGPSKKTTPQKKGKSTSAKKSKVPGKRYPSPPPPRLPRPLAGLNKKGNSTKTSTKAGAKGKGGKK